MKKKVINAFNEMKEQCEIIANFYKKGEIYESWIKAYDAISNQIQIFRDMISGMYIYEIIDEDFFNKAFEMSTEVSAIDLLH